VERIVPAGWNLDSISADVTVLADGTCGHVKLTVTNSPKLGCLDIIKNVIWSGFTPNPAKEFEFTVTGPAPSTAIIATLEFDYQGNWHSGDSLPIMGLIPGDYTVTESDPGPEWIVTPGLLQIATVAPYIGEPGTECQTVEFTNTHIILHMKTFTDSGALNGFTPPEIFNEGLVSYVYETHSGPSIWWEITYYFENEDDEGHYFNLWDKWGGNLLALGSQPTAFDLATNTLTLASGETFIINYAGYSSYIGTGKDITANINAPDQTGNPPPSEAWITLHKGDKQQGNNPGKGKGTGNDGKSYDADIDWDIGYLAPGESAMLTIYVAPGLNPGGILQFSSPGCEYINTGPRVRVYDDEDGDGDPYEKKEFQYSIEDTNKLKVCVDTATPILDEGDNEVGVVLLGSDEENCLEIHIWINTDSGYDDTYNFLLTHGWYDPISPYNWMYEYIHPEDIVISGGTGELHLSCQDIPQDSRFNNHYFSISLTGQVYAIHLDTIPYTVIEIA